ncbi:MAG: hypothetical protein AAFY83_06355 [Pseudomonadota bacterium]
MDIVIYGLFIFSLAANIWLALRYKHIMGGTIAQSTEYSAQSVLNYNNTVSKQNHLRNTIQIMYSLTLIQVDKVVQKLESKSIKPHEVSRDIRGCLEALTSIYLAPFLDIDDLTIDFLDWLYQLTSRLQSLYATDFIVSIDCLPTRKLEQNAAIALGLLIKQIFDCAVLADIIELKIKMEPDDFGDSILFSGVNGTCIKQFIDRKHDVVHELIDELGGYISIDHYNEESKISTLRLHLPHGRLKG